MAPVIPPSSPPAQASPRSVSPVQLSQEERLASLGRERRGLRDKASFPTLPPALGMQRPLGCFCQGKGCNPQCNCDASLVSVGASPHQELGQAWLQAPRCLWPPQPT